MKTEKREGFDVIGLSARVRNDEPSGIAPLWARFYESGLRERLPGAAGNNIFCVYHDYEGDHTAPYVMTIGYGVPDGTACPAGLSRASVPPQVYAVFEAIGAQPAALVSQWQAI